MLRVCVRARRLRQTAHDEALALGDAVAASSVAAASGLYDDIAARIAPLERDRHARMLRAVAALVANAKSPAPMAASDNAAAAAVAGTRGAADVDAAEAACDAATAGATSPLARAAVKDSVIKGSAVAKRLGAAVLYPGRDALLAMDLERFARNIIDDEEEQKAMLATLAAFRAM